MTISCIREKNREKSLRKAFRYTQMVLQTFFCVFYYIFLHKPQNHILVCYLDTKAQPKSVSRRYVTIRLAKKRHVTIVACGNTFNANFPGLKVKYLV